MNIAIQDYPESFHHEAAQKHFGKDAQITAYTSFKTLINEVVYCNSINGKVYLPIRQQLITNKGLALREIREVHSHYFTTYRKCKPNQKNIKIELTLNTQQNGK